MDVVDVQTIFNNVWSLPIYESVVNEYKLDPKTVFNWIYVFMYGNIVKKDLDF